MSVREGSSVYLADAQQYNPPSPPDISREAWARETYGERAATGINAGINAFFHRGNYKDWKENKNNVYNAELSAYNTNFQNAYNSEAAQLERQRAAGLNSYYTNTQSSQSASPGFQTEYNEPSSDNAIGDIVGTVTGLADTFLGLKTGFQNLTKTAEEIEGIKADNANKVLEGELIKENTNRLRLSNAWIDNLNGQKYRLWGTNIMGNKLNNSRNASFLYGSDLPFYYKANPDLAPAPTPGSYQGTFLQTGIGNMNTEFNYNSEVYSPENAKFQTQLHKLGVSAQALQNKAMSLDNEKQEKLNTIVGDYVEKAKFEMSLVLQNKGDIFEAQKNIVARALKDSKYALKKAGFDNVMDYAKPIADLVEGVVGSAAQVYSAFNYGTMVRGLGDKWSQVQPMLVSKHHFAGHGREQGDWGETYTYK